MATIYDCSDDSDLLTGMRLARGAIGRGELIVIPTDTVYGVAADAFSPTAVQRLLDAKGRGRQSPPPVLVPGIPTLAALAETVPPEVDALVKAFWPGGLTIVLPAAPSLAWDLGETRGTVALRMPQHRIALELLSETGPLAVSSANLTGRPAARTAQEASAMLGDSVSVYLDGGEAGTGYAHVEGEDSSSTIVDATALAAGMGKLRILRHGVISADQLREVVGDALGDDAPADASAAESPVDEDASAVEGSPVDEDTSAAEGSPVDQDTSAAEESPVDEDTPAAGGTVGGTSAIADAPADATPVIIRAPSLIPPASDAPAEAPADTPAQPAPAVSAETPAPTEPPIEPTETPSGT